MTREARNHREKGAQNLESKSKNRSGTLTGVGVDVRYGSAGTSVKILFGSICPRRPQASSRIASTLTVRGEENRSRVESAYS